MTALLFSYRFIALSHFKNDISASVHLLRILFMDIYVVLRKLSYEGLYMQCKPKSVRSNSKNSFLVEIYNDTQGRKLQKLSSPFMMLTLA